MKYKIIIPQEKSKEEVCNCGLKKSEHNVRNPFIPRKETLKEAAQNYSEEWGENDDEKSFIEGAKWQAKKNVY